MKYLLSVWCDDCFRPIQLNATMYEEDGSLYHMEVWSPEGSGLANAIYEVADRIARFEVQMTLGDESFEWPAGEDAESPQA